jgi:heat shock protein HslJ
VLSSWTTAEGDVSLPPDKSITFELKDGVAFGRSSVNQYRFALDISEQGVISWKPGVSTMMAGSEKNMAFEKRYMDTLPKVSSIGQDESGQLILTTPNDALIFSPGKMFFAGDGIFN